MLKSLQKTIIVNFMVDSTIVDGDLMNSFCPLTVRNKFVLSSKRDQYKEQSPWPGFETFRFLGKYLNTLYDMEQSEGFLRYQTTRITLVIKFLMC